MKGVGGWEWAQTIRVGLMRGGPNVEGSGLMVRLAVDFVGFVSCHAGRPPPARPPPQPAAALLLNWPRPRRLEVRPVQFHGLEVRPAQFFGSR